MVEFFSMIALFLMLVAAPILFVYGSYKLTDDIGGGLFAGSFVCLYYGYLIAAACLEYV